MPGLPYVTAFPTPPPLPPLPASTSSDSSLQAPGLPALAKPVLQHLCYAQPLRGLCTYATAAAVKAPPQLVAVYGTVPGECAAQNGKLYLFNNRTYSVALYVNGALECPPNLLVGLAPQMQFPCLIAPGTMCSAVATAGTPPATEAIHVFDRAATATEQAAVNISGARALPSGTLLFAQPMATYFLASASASRYAVRQVQIISAALDSVAASYSAGAVVSAFANALAADAGVSDVYIQQDACAPGAPLTMRCTVVAAVPPANAPSSWYHTTNSPVYHVDAWTVSTGLLAEPLPGGGAATTSSSSAASDLVAAALPVARYARREYPSTDATATLVAWLLLVLVLVLFCAALLAAPSQWGAAAVAKRR